MQEWSRRRLLAAAGAAVGTAGCATLTQERTDRADPGADGATPADGAGGSRSFAAVYDRTIDSVVSVRVYDGTRHRSGSGFVFAEGTVVTNQHVVEGAETVRLAYSDGDWTTAAVSETDVYADLAALSPAERSSGAEPLGLRSADPPIGTRVVALGNPFGLEASASSGIVSGVDRSLEGANDFPIPDAIQTDAAVNPGNSGGPLVDLDGRVVGVITAGGGENLGFAISAPLARRIVPVLAEGEAYSHPYVGVRLLTVTPDLAEAGDLSLDPPRGVLVSEVVDGTPADGVLRGSPDSAVVHGTRYPVGGDVILAVDGTPTPTLQQLTSLLALETSPGDAVDVAVLRDGGRRTLSLTLGERPPPP